MQAEARPRPDRTVSSHVTMIAIVHPSTSIHLASSHALFLFAEPNKHVLLVEARDDAFLGLGVAVNEIDHRASMLDCFGSIMITLQCTWAAAGNPNLGKWQSTLDW